MKSTVLELTPAVGTPLAAPRDRTHATAELPVVPAATDRDRAHSRPSRWRAGTLWALTLVIAAELTLVSALHWNLIAVPGHAPQTVRTSSRPTSAGAVIAQTEADGQGASYDVAASSFTVTLATSRRTWVEARSTDGTTSFAGIMGPDDSRRFESSTPLTLEVGAGGATVDIVTGGHSQTLQPPSAPFTFRFAPVLHAGDLRA